MSGDHVLLIIFTSFLLAGLSGLVYAEMETVNGSQNISPSGNISSNETNQTDPDQNGIHSGKTNITGNRVTGGGIKNFMKSFTYQSGI
jgi:hypothetical protein